MEDGSVVSAMYGVLVRDFRTYVVCNCYMGDVACCCEFVGREKFSRKYDGLTGQSSRRPGQ